MIRVFTPYLASFELGGKTHLATLDRGIVLVEAVRDDFPEHDEHLVSRFRAAFNLSQRFMVVREYGFPTLMHDLEGLALCLAAFAVHLGLAKRVSEALQRFAPQLAAKASVRAQYFGGAYVEEAGGYRPTVLDESLRIVAVKQGGSVRYIPTPRQNLVSKVGELVAQMPASNIRVYSTNSLGTALYFTSPSP